MADIQHLKQGDDVTIQEVIPWYHNDPSLWFSSCDLNRTLPNITDRTTSTKGNPRSSFRYRYDYYVRH